MIRGWKFSLAAMLLFAGWNAHAESEPVRYMLSPIMQDGALKAMLVRIEFHANPSGTTELDLPDHWGGEKDLWRELKSIKIAGGHAKVEAVTDPAKRIIHSDPGALITVRYRATQDWQGEPGAGDNTYRLVVQPAYFHLIGHALFAHPKDDTPLPATFAIRGLPRKWSFASTLEKRPLTTDDIEASITVGGDFRVIAPDELHGLARIAIRGAWQFTDAEFADDMVRILKAEWAYWGDAPSPFLVTVLQQKSGQYVSLGGTGLNAGFSFFATSNVEKNAILRTLAHENMHNWIPVQIGGFPDKDEAAGYWLSEGFTDFFSRRVLLSSGIWTLEQYVKLLNGTLYDYATSPARNVPNADIVKDFWNDNAVQQLPYQRGDLIAVLWDAEMHGGMDVVIHDMRDRAKTAPKGEDAPTLFLRTIKDHGLDVSADIARYIARGETIRLPADIFRACGKMVTVSLPGYDYGFDAKATAEAGHIVTGLDPAGPAYAAGLRNGMKIVQHISPSSTDPRDPLSYEVSDNGRDFVVQYFPASKEHYDAQQLELVPGLNGEAEKHCIAELTGG